jgi:hypothetical protein
MEERKLRKEPCNHNQSFGRDSNQGLSKNYTFNLLSIIASWRKSPEYYVTFLLSVTASSCKSPEFYTTLNMLSFAVPSCWSPLGFLQQRLTLWKWTRYEPMIRQGMGCNTKITKHSSNFMNYAWRTPNRDSRSWQREIVTTSPHMANYVPTIMALKWRQCSRSGLMNKVTVLFPVICSYLNTYLIEGACALCAKSTKLKKFNGNILPTHTRVFHYVKLLNGFRWHLISTGLHKKLSGEYNFSSWKKWTDVFRPQIIIQYVLWIYPLCNAHL